MIKIRFMAFALILASLLSASAQAGEPRRFALLVGINQYADSGLVALTKAQNDAEDVGALLKKAGGYRVVTVMTGSKSFNDADFPSRAKIIERVEAFADTVKPDDQVLLFFSGHGVNGADGESYFLPIDAQVKDPLGSGISLRRDVIAKFEAAGAKNVVALVDACQKTVNKDKAIRVVGIDEVKNVASAVVLTATGKGKVSYEDPNGANGLFTRSLLLGLRGDADLNRDGLVSVQELATFLPDSVAEYALSVGMSQKPSVFDPGSGKLQPPLIKTGTASMTSETPQASGQSVTVASQTPVATAKAQYVQFKVPEGARVDLRVLLPDGREVLNLPDTVSVDRKLEPGNYRVEAQERSYLYYPFTGNLTVGASKTAFQIDLRPNFGSLSVACDPADGVEVVINGRKEGTLSGSALSIPRLKSGSYEVILSRDLYDTKRLTVQIEDGKPASVKEKLIPNFFTLGVTEANARAATLFVDGRQMGKLPQTIPLAFRDATLRVVPDDSRYKEWTGTVKPKAKGSKETVTASCAGRFGSLDVSTDLSIDAEIFVGGVKVGTAPLEHELLVGDYEVTARGVSGGKTYTGVGKATVREGQVISVSLSLAAPVAPVAVTPAALPEKAPSGDFVRIPGGTFMMGSPASEPFRESTETQHQVTVSSFMMGKYEVTQAEWIAVMGSNPSSFKGNKLPVEQVSWFDILVYCNKRSMKEGRTPCYSINGSTDPGKWGSVPTAKNAAWDQAVCNFKANGYRLPTEAEWEFACRAGTSTPFSTGNNVTTTQANYDGNNPYNGNAKGEYRQKTVPVGSFAANGFGLYDMHGNVWEWCWDWYGNYANGAQTDPVGASSGVIRVSRGGGWDNYGQYLRSAFRNYWDPWIRGFSIGFRLVSP